MYHGVMFHHFHEEKTDTTGVMPGSVELNQFEFIISYLKKKFCLNDAADWTEKARTNRLSENDICITCDDTIKNQYTKGKIVLDLFDIKAFFFPYTAMYEKRLPRLEIYRFFITKCYPFFDAFFSDFLEKISKLTDLSIEITLKRFPEEYLNQFSFYSRNERIYRFIRDRILTIEQYTNTMDQLISTRSSLMDLSKNVWMSKEDLFELSQQGHILGLHSTTHPFNMSALDDDDQRREYNVNLDQLRRISQKDIVSISYPSGSYNDFTIELMKELGVIVGFRSDMKRGTDPLLEIPRMDSAFLLKTMGR